MATPANRQDIRNRIRRRLSAWQDDNGTLSGSLNDSATTFTLAASMDLAERSLLEMDSEVMRLVSYVAGSTTVSKVMRGDHGTTPASHTNGAAIKCFPPWGWTDYDINVEIDAAIDWLWPDVWVLTPLENTLLSGYKEFGLPTGVTYPNGELVKKVELQDENGVYREILGWSHKGDRLILARKTEKDYTARIWKQGKHSRLTADNTQLTNTDPEEAIVLYAASRCLDQLVANRVRYTEYSASLNDRASTPDELQRTAYSFFNQAVICKDRISRPGLSGMASTRREG